MKYFLYKFRGLILAVIVSLAGSAPLFASAAPSTFSDFVLLIIDLIKTAIPLISSLAVLVFIWGLVKFIAAAGDAKSHANGRQLMVWGSIALFVLVSIWGILSFLSQQFDFGNNAGIPLLPEN